MKGCSLLVLTGLIVCFAVTACKPVPVPNNNSGPTPSPSTFCCLPSPSPTPTIDPEQLVRKIKQLQKEYVQDSTGLEAGECFTDDDLNQFNADKKTAEIVAGLQKDKDFTALLAAIRGMTPARRGELLDRALDTYRRTWLELHLNPKTASAERLREGQTDAGMRAEKLIAKTVVDFVKEKI
jgi:hypothetical protein